MIGNTKNRFFRLFAILIAALCMLSVINTFTVSAAASNEDSELEVLYGKTAGVMTGTPQDEIAKAKIKNVKLQYFNSATDLAAALKSKKIDFYVLSSVNFYNMAEQYPEFAYIKESLTTYNVGSIFSRTDKGKSVRKEFNKYIEKIKSDGRLDDFQNKWLDSGTEENIDIPKTGKNGILKMATINTLKPFSYMLNGKNVGFDIAIAADFCKEYGYGLDIDNSDFAGVLTGVSTGKYDFAAGQISWTEERAESVDFSDFYYLQKIVAIVNSENISTPNLVMSDKNRNRNNSDAEASFDEQGKTLTIFDSIRKTLIDEDRWITIAQGLFVTVIITFFGFVFANLFGALFCAMSFSRSKILKALAAVYSALMQGLPTVVILMIFYYVIFAHSDISNVGVSVFSFGLVYGAYMQQLFRGSIKAVDIGQWEAALAIGFTKRQAFRGIVLPQALRNMLHGYFSNLISLMKATSIVGYIAVTDLTKVGDIIRGSTYEAIVPLVTVAIVYFLIAALLFAVMNLVQMRLNQKCRKRSSNNLSKE